MKPEHTCGDARADGIAKALFARFHPVSKRWILSPARARRFSRLYAAGYSAKQASVRGHRVWQLGKDGNWLPIRDAIKSCTGS